MPLVSGLGSKTACCGFKSASGIFCSPRTSASDPPERGRPVNRTHQTQNNQNVNNGLLQRQRCHSDGRCDASHSSVPFLSIVYTARESRQHGEHSHTYADVEREESRPMLDAKWTEWIDQEFVGCGWRAPKSTSTVFQGATNIQYSVIQRMYSAAILLVHLESLGH